MRRVTLCFFAWIASAILYGNSNSIFEEKLQDLRTHFNQEASNEVNQEVVDEAMRQALISSGSFEESFQIMEDLLVNYMPTKKQQAYPIIDVHESNIQELFDTSRPVIIDVYTDWCGPCKYFALVINELNQLYGDVYQFAKLNAEKERQLAKYWNITAYPTILFFKDGVEVGRHKGFMNKEDFLDLIEKSFPDFEQSK